MAEDYLLGGPGVTVSNFTTGTIGQFLDDVVRRADTDPVEHMRRPRCNGPGRCSAVT